MTVYVEYVFLDNFFIDFFILKLTIKIVGKTCSKRRILLSSFLGGIEALTYPLINYYIPFLLPIKITFGLLLTAVLGGYKKMKEYYIVSAVFFFLTFAVGGAIFGVFSLFDIPFDKEICIALMILPVYVLIKIFEGIIGFIYKNKKTVNNLFDCELNLNGKILKLVGFFDTGNNLYDGDSPVIIVEKKTALKLIGDSFYKIKFKKISVNTVSSSEKLTSFKLTELKIYFGQVENIYNDVTVCVSNKKIGNFYGVILHPDLKEIENDNKRFEKIS